MWPLKRRRRKKGYDYYAAIVQRAVPLARKWKYRLDAATGAQDLVKVNRCMRALRRICVVQQGALAETQRRSW